MRSRQKVSIGIEDNVRIRARLVCEYCHTSEEWQYVKFTVDHIRRADLTVGRHPPPNDPVQSEEAEK